VGACDVIVVSAVCDAIGDAASSAGLSVTSAIGDWMAGAMADLAAGAVGLACRAVDSTTAIDLNAGWLRNNYSLVLPVGLVVTVGTFCLQLVLAAWRRDGAALAQAVTGTVTGVFFAFAVISVTTVALGVVDALSAGLFQVAQTSVADVIRRLIKVTNLAKTNSLGWAIPAVVGFGCAVGAFAYWAVMVARKVALLILVILAAFAGAGGGWEPTRRWRRGWIEATGTLVVSKLLMTIVFLVGVSAMGRTRPGDGLAALSDAMAGLVVLVLVILCPYATYKFIHWAADGPGQQDVHRGGMAGMATASAAARNAGTLAAQTGMARPPQGPRQVPGLSQDGVLAGLDPGTGRTPPPQQSAPNTGTPTPDTDGPRPPSSSTSDEPHPGHAGNGPPPTQPPAAPDAPHPPPSPISPPAPADPGPPPHGSPPPAPPGSSSER
jgi:hypothetical protein